MKRITPPHYEWRLSDLPELPSNAPTVLSTFCGGGGSSMGYRLAGYKVLAALDIDTKMLDNYEHNLDTPVVLCGDIRKLAENPKRVLTRAFTQAGYDKMPRIDLLDGSPPCTLFSHGRGVAHDSADWSAERSYAEGAVTQRLDDLFEHWCTLAKNLQPKYAIAENVMGLLHTEKAKPFVKAIYASMIAAGYQGTHYVVKGDRCGLPQMRERVFFVFTRKDLPFPHLNLLPYHGQKLIPFSAIDDKTDTAATNHAESHIRYYNMMKARRLYGPFQKVAGAGRFFSLVRVDPNKACSTISASGAPWHPEYQRYLNVREMRLASSWPQDYEFVNKKPVYVMGMSVPPLLTWVIAHAFRTQVIEAPAGARGTSLFDS